MNCSKRASNSNRYTTVHKQLNGTQSVSCCGWNILSDREKGKKSKGKVKQGGARKVTRSNGRSCICNKSKENGRPANEFKCIANKLLARIFQYRQIFLIANASQHSTHSLSQSHSHSVFFIRSKWNEISAHAHKMNECSVIRARTTNHFGTWPISFCSWSLSNTDPFLHQSHSRAHTHTRTHALLPALCLSRCLSLSLALLPHALLMCVWRFTRVCNHLECRNRAQHSVEPSTSNL